MKFSVLTVISFIASALAVFTGAQADQWRALPDKDLRVKAGTALDFTQVFGQPQPVTSRIVVNGAGQLSLPGDRNERMRFLCAPLAYGGPNGPFPDHESADGFAEQMVRQGYNLARFHFGGRMILTTIRYRSIGSTICSGH